MLTLVFVGTLRYSISPAKSSNSVCVCVEGGCVCVCVCGRRGCGWCVCVGVSVCVCVCVAEDSALGGGLRIYVCARARACVCVFERACVLMCLRARVCVCVCVYMSVCLFISAYTCVLGGGGGTYRVAEWLSQQTNMGHEQRGTKRLLLNNCTPFAHKRCILVGVNKRTTRCTKRDHCSEDTRSLSILRPLVKYTMNLEAATSIIKTQAYGVPT